MVALCLGLVLCSAAGADMHGTSALPAAIAPDDVLRGILFQVTQHDRIRVDFRVKTYLAPYGSGNVLVSPLAEGTTVVGWPDRFRTDVRFGDGGAKTAVFSRDGDRYVLFDADQLQYMAGTVAEAGGPDRTLLLREALSLGGSTPTVADSAHSPGPVVLAGFWPAAGEGGGWDVALSVAGEDGTRVVVVNPESGSLRAVWHTQSHDWGVMCVLVEYGSWIWEAPDSVLTFEIPAQARQVRSLMIDLTEGRLDSCQSGSERPSRG